MNSLDRSIASDKNKAGPYTSLEKIIEKEKVSVKSPRTFQQEVSIFSILNANLCEDFWKG